MGQHSQKTDVAAPEKAGPQSEGKSERASGARRFLEMEKRQRGIAGTEPLGIEI